MIYYYYYLHTDTLEHFVGLIPWCMGVCLCMYVGRTNTNIVIETIAVQWEFLDASIAVRYWYDNYCGNINSHGPVQITKSKHEEKIIE